MFSPRPRLLVWDNGIGIGGIDRVTTSLIPELAKWFSHTDVLIPRHAHKRFSPYVDGDESIRLVDPYNHSDYYSQNALSKVLHRLQQICSKNPSTLRYLSRVETKLRVTSAISQLRSDVVLVTALIDQPWPAAQIPTFGVIHDLIAPHADRPDKNRCLTEWLYKASGVITISDYVKNSIVERYRHIRAPIVVVPNAVSPPLHVSESKVRPDTPRTLFYPASFREHKGHDFLIKALRDLYDEGLEFRLILCGADTELIGSENPLREDTMERARQTFRESPSGFQKRIRAFGFVSQDKVESFYSLCDLVVLPSRHEGFGLPLTEAAFRSKPVLASKLPSFLEQIDLYALHQVVRSRSLKTSQWKEELRLFSEEPCTWKTLSRNEIIERSSKYTWRKAGAKYAHFFFQSERG